MDRRRFLQSAGAAGLGAVGVAALGSTVLGAAPAGAAPASAAHRERAQEAAGSGPSDVAILNFALNLEYLEGEFYHRAAYGTGLPDSLTHGRGGRGRVEGGREVPFRSRLVRRVADDIARDERLHVQFLREALGGSKVGLPTIDIKSSFTAAARAAGLIGPHQSFDPYANENNFLLAAYIFEDVGVTAYKGAAPLINNPTYLGAAAGILSVEAYHAGVIRTLLFERGLGEAADKISRARDSLDNRRDDDKGVTIRGHFSVAPTDANAQVFGRTPGDVLNIVYLTPNRARRGGFFPNGVHGSINTSSSM